MLLRQQQRIVERKHAYGACIPQWQKVPLAVLPHRLKEIASGAREKVAARMKLFKPNTLLKWHGALVRRKWTFKEKKPGGRPRTNSAI